MSKWLRIRIADKLFIPFVGILFISVLLTIYVIIRVQGQGDADQLESYFTRLKVQWRAVTEYHLTNYGTEELSKVYQKLTESDQLLLSIKLIDRGGKVLASSSSEIQRNAGSHRLQTPISNVNGYSGTVVTEYASFGNGNKSFSLVFTILLVGLSTIFGGSLIYNYVLNQVLIKRIKKAISVASSIADRDLTMRLEVLGEDELTSLATSFNAMADNLTELVSAIYITVKDLDQKASGILSSVDFQAEQSSNQSLQVGQITNAMSEIVDVTKTIAEKSASLVGIADNTRQSVERGVIATDHSLKLMDEISVTSRERILQIKELHRRANQVGEVMEFIEQIADQTKLIAFNASIEAAGAGEMGRRFEVVAREIRRLAENVADSASQIQSRISDIQQSAERLTEGIESEVKIVKTGTESALNIVNLLHSIRDGANQTTMQLDTIFHSVQSQDVSSNNLLTSLKEIDSQSIALKDGLMSLSGIAQALKSLSGDLRNVSGSFNYNKLDKQN